MTRYDVRPMPFKGDDVIIKHHWVSQKSCRSLSLTQEVWRVLGVLANDCGNRSEVIEILIRYAEIADLDLLSIRKELVQAIPRKLEKPNEEYLELRQTIWKKEEERLAMKEAKKARTNERMAEAVIRSIQEQEEPEQPETANNIDTCSVEPVCPLPTPTASDEEVDFDTPIQTPAVSQCSI